MEAYTKHGLNVHAVIFDELHSQPNRELFDVMTKGSGGCQDTAFVFSDHYGGYGPAFGLF